MPARVLASAESLQKPALRISRIACAPYLQLPQPLRTAHALRCVLPASPHVAQPQVTLIGLTGAVYAASRESNARQSVATLQTTSFGSVTGQDGQDRRGCVDDPAFTCEQREEGIRVTSAEAVRWEGRRAALAALSVVTGFTTAGFLMRRVFWLRRNPG